MKPLSEIQLPLTTDEFSKVLTDEQVQKFNEIIGRQKQTVPLSIGAVCMPGAFKLLDELGVDWSKLLHISQRFEYLSFDEDGREMKAKTQLTRLRVRAGSYWLQFETDVEFGRGKFKFMSQIVVGGAEAE